MTQEAFKAWWYSEGSHPPYTYHDCEEHTMRMCEIAWANGAYKERETLAQTQEPHGWYIDGYGAVIGSAEPKSVRVGEWLPWYTSPPQRTWVGLTAEEMKELWENKGWYVTMYKAVEAKLKEKNT